MATVPSYRPTANRAGLESEKSRDVTLVTQLKILSGHCNTYTEMINPVTVVKRFSDFLDSGS